MLIFAVTDTASYCKNMLSKFISVSLASATHSPYSTYVQYWTHLQNLVFDEILQTQRLFATLTVFRHVNDFPQFIVLQMSSSCSVLTC